MAFCTDNVSINSLYSKKLRCLLKFLFNNPENPDLDFVIPYILSNPNGDITLYYNSLVMKKVPEKDMIYKLIVNMSYDYVVKTLLAEEEILDVSKEKDIDFISISQYQSYSQPKKERKPIPIIIKGRK
jgi:hypothetical protein